MKLPPPPGAHPRDHPDDRAEFAAWLETYNRRAAEFATCRFLESTGADTVHPDVAPILRVHDDYTKARLQLPLA
jgi:hypothetical protein